MIPIYFDELADVLTACVRLPADQCSPTQLRELMADHLMNTNPRLADAVLRFDGPQLMALSAFVFQAQALVGMCNPIPKAPTRTHITPLQAHAAV